MANNYLFGPFVGETVYELNYFVGHAIYLRKQDPRNKIIVLTRREHFDLYGKYATTLLQLPLDPDLIPEKFRCENMRPNVFEEIVRRFRNKYRPKIKICEHFYPYITSCLRDIKWYYPRDQLDFDFKPRDANKILAYDISENCKKIIISSFHDTFTKHDGCHIFPTSYFYNTLKIRSQYDISVLGLLIEMIRLSECVLADIDDVVGRLAMLIQKPLITKRDFLDAQYLNPINPYESVVIGCQDLKDGIDYVRRLK